MNQAKVLVHQGLCMCGTLDTSSLWILVQNAKCCSCKKNVPLVCSRLCTFPLCDPLYGVSVTFRLSAIHVYWCNLWSLVCWSSRGQLGYTIAFCLRKRLGN